MQTTTTTTYEQAALGRVRKRTTRCSPALHVALSLFVWLCAVVMRMRTCRPRLGPSHEVYGVRGSKQQRTLITTLLTFGE